METDWILTVGAVSKTIRVIMLYSGDSRNCITCQKMHCKEETRKRYVEQKMNKAEEIHTFEIAIASSKPGGGVSSSSPNFNSPNLLIKSITRSIEVGKE